MNNSLGGALEITMTIKCGMCITHSNFSLKRSDIRDELSLAKTINSHHMRNFTARRTQGDAVQIRCNKCGHLDWLALK